MTPAPSLADAVRDLPAGLSAEPAGPSDVAAITELIRANELGAFDTSATNPAEVEESLEAPDCRWGQGALVVRRDGAGVAALVCYDGLAEERGWDIEVWLAPGDPQRAGIAAALLDAGLSEGRRRFEALAPDERPAAAPKVRSFCFPDDTVLIAMLESRGLVEGRRYWRMRIDHGPRAGRTAQVGPGGAGGPGGSGAGPGGAAAGGPGAAAGPGASDAAGGSGAAPAVPLPEGFRIAPAAGRHRELNAVGNAAFADHFDAVDLPFETWEAFMVGPTSDESQWLVVEHAGRVVGYALGSNRYAAEGCGYVATLAVLREHRRRGLAGALLRARFADDSARGFTATLLHCDSENLTGATRLYEDVGMHADQVHIMRWRDLMG